MTAARAVEGDVTVTIDGKTAMRGFVSASEPSRRQSMIWANPDRPAPAGGPTLRDKFDACERAGHIRSRVAATSDFPQFIEIKRCGEVTKEIVEHFVRKGSFRYQFIRLPLSLSCNGHRFRVVADIPIKRVELPNGTDRRFFETFRRFFERLALRIGNLGEQGSKYDGQHGSAGRGADQFISGALGEATDDAFEIVLSAHGVPLVFK
jgi:hypothetical protein